MLFDTDVLIWAFRGNGRAVRVIDADEAPAVSAVSRMELFQGARNGKELGVIRSFLRRFETAPLSENIGLRAEIYMEEHALRHGLGVADALIAATAIERKSLLCSANAKHYRPISEVELKIFRP